MAISNYGELKTQLGIVLFHQRFTPNYDTATLKFERVINRRMRVRLQETSTALTTVAGAVALPTDFLKQRALLWKGRTPYVPLDYVHPTYLETTAVGLGFQIIGGGVPVIYTIEGSTIKIRRADNTANIFEFHYYQKLPSLTLGVNPDPNMNWLLTNYPDAYEYGVLVELFVLARNKEAAELYKLRRDEVFMEIKQDLASSMDPSSRHVREAEYY